MGITGVAVHGPEDGGALHVRAPPSPCPSPATWTSKPSSTPPPCPGRRPAPRLRLPLRESRPRRRLRRRRDRLRRSPAGGHAPPGGQAPGAGPRPLPGGAGAGRLRRPGRRGRAHPRAAAEIGFPLLVKAALAVGAGDPARGAGRRPPAALLSARREAQSAFGDPTIYLEKGAPRARHIEVQVLADAHGNVVHLGERECSVQRRHQKVLEEAPSPAVTPELRERLGGYAVRLAAAAGYVNAGTAEFLLTPAGAPEGAPHFLEVNARLQVEHPVTEQVTGIDLVREQIRIAAGQPLSFRQEDVRWRGHALQCRVYAEDPRASFPPRRRPRPPLRAPAGRGDPQRRGRGDRRRGLRPLRPPPGQAHRLGPRPPPPPSPGPATRCAATPFSASPPTSPCCERSSPPPPSRTRSGTPEPWSASSLTSSRLIPRRRAGRPRPRRTLSSSPPAGASPPPGALPLAPGGPGGAPALPAGRPGGTGHRLAHRGRLGAGRRRHPLHPPLPAHLPPSP